MSTALTVAVQGLTILSADMLNTYEQTCDTVAQLRGFSGTDGLQVFARGLATVADGGQGPFVWELVANPVDDGVNTIVPYGQTSAAWIRVPLSGQLIPVSTFTAGSAITLSNSDFMLNVNKTVGSATTVSLPSNPALGQVLAIKDGRGDCQVNPITLNGGGYTIDGAATYVMNIDFMSITLFFNGTGWGVW